MRGNLEKENSEVTNQAGTPLGSQLSWAIGAYRILEIRKDGTKGPGTPVIAEQ